MYLDIHSHTQHSTADTLVIRNQYPLTANTTEPFSVGIHPWYVENWKLQWEALVPLAKHPNCWAIGECGLDKNITTPLPLQQEIFLKHIYLAETLELPLIIHCVKAYSEVLHLRKITKTKQLWILHGFRKNLKVAEECIAHNIALSFGKPLTYSPQLQEVYKSISPEYRFFESDDEEMSISKFTNFLIDKFAN
jgi:tatD family protein|nr:TatD family hydrolase [uncultured Capnocytophaga sp.]